MSIQRLVLASCILCFLGCDNGRPEYTTSLGDHELTIYDTSGKPLGGTSGTQTDENGNTFHTFKSANGRYEFKLVDQVLTLNGERYTLENSNDPISITEDEVKVNGVVTLPDSDSETGS